jgi:hypothetical protein
MSHVAIFYSKQRRVWFLADTADERQIGRSHRTPEAAARAKVRFDLEIAHSGPRGRAYFFKWTQHQGEGAPTPGWDTRKKWVTEVAQEGHLIPIDQKEYERLDYEKWLVEAKWAKENAWD